MKSITLSHMVTVIILNHFKLKSNVKRHSGRLICLTQEEGMVEMETEKTTWEHIFIFTALKYYINARV